MKTIKTILLLGLTLLHAEELEKEIRYIGNDGKISTHQVVCHNGNSGMVTIDLQTKEMSVDSVNIGKATFKDAAERICR